MFDISIASFCLSRYGGHIHQLRFRQGHTYGEETHRLAQDYPRLKRTQSEIIKVDQSDTYVTREFPDGIIPGYTGELLFFSCFDLQKGSYTSQGYVPQRKYQNGARYRIETDACNATTKATYEQERQKMRNLDRTISAYPKSKPLNSETVVKHVLDYHRAYHPTEISQRGRRSTDC